MVARLACLLFSLFVLRSTTYKQDSVELWLCFELPFYLVNAATVVVYYEWRQISDILGTTAGADVSETVRNSFMVVKPVDYRLNQSEFFVDPNDAPITTSQQKRDHTQMVTVVTVIAILEILYLISTVLQVFEQTMSYILAGVYGLVVLVYFPLFCQITTKFQRALPEEYSRLKPRIFTVFCLFIALLAIRYAIYLSLLFAKLEFFQITNLRNYVPFYVSELGVTFGYVYFLVRVGSQQS